MQILSKLSSMKNFKYATSTKDDGNMSFKWGDSKDVAINRKNFLKKVNILPSNCVVMNLQHGTGISHVDSSVKGRGIYEPGGLEADCLITSEKEVYLFMLTGDCLPVVIYDQKRNVLALAHISRMNTSQLFIQKLIKHLIIEFKCPPEDLKVSIGPAIHKESYIKEEVAEKRNPAWQKFITNRPDGKILIDLIGYNKKQMIESGILSQHIEVSDIDTAQSLKFFSHRRSETTGEPEGRFATVVGLIIK